MIKWTESDWYKSLVEELDAAIVEGSYDIEYKKVEWNHNIGRLIRESSDRAGNVTTLVQSLSVDLKKSERGLWNALYIYDQWPNIDSLPYGKSVTMNKLLKGKEAAEKSEECLHTKVVIIHKCKECGKKIDKK